MLTATPPADPAALAPDTLIVPVPAGHELLPRGPVRRIRVDPLQIGHRCGLPCVVTEVDGPHETRRFAAVEILGPARLVHDPRAGGCGAVFLETAEPLLARL